MKIGLNATCFDDRPSGAKQRFVGLYGEVIRRLHNDEFIVYEPADCNLRSWFPNHENVVFKQTPLLSQNRLQKYLKGLLYWPKTLKSEGLDLFEEFSLPLVRAPIGKTLLTVHDIRGVSYQKAWPKRWFYKTILEHSLKAADHVLTVSESVRDEILHLYPRTRISVIYNGIDADSFKNFPRSDSKRVQERFDLPANFILAVGHFEERKNYITLIEALNSLREKGSLVNLVIVGNDSGFRAGVEDRIGSLELSSHVRILSGLTDTEVRCVYDLCDLFVFPSTYEGFGIPILEAMAAKKPIVLSDISIFQEITQGQAAYFSCDDPDSMAFAIKEVLTTRTKRDDLVKYGNKRILDFDFREISGTLEDLYKTLLKS